MVGKSECLWFYLCLCDSFFDDVTFEYSVNISISIAKCDIHKYMKYGNKVINA